ncbi:MAG: cysteine--trna ligase [Edafosvirus sp.]|uniref:cysteine--tRNA ligase n=1 Tax=Edafosvirus sp. TaxID=2487765 RepID=A0A3G4ZST9_9VIRU|nr:MAG: cysteine--trna ligase [Edafosvirus sp.]
MSINILNSLTGQLEVLDTNHTIKWYICGPTVYDHAHLGHARNYIVFDTMRRILENYFNKNVIYVMNITDIDDKIINKADKEYGIPDLEKCKLISNLYEASFWEDFDNLNIQKPTVTTRVTEYIDKMVVYIQKLMENNYAYKDADGSIYFNSENFSEDGFSDNPFNIKQSEITEEQSSKDFCLWKSQKEHGVYFDTVLGKGTPGWHLECSTMANHVLGKDMDIHSGGIDLKFPHHTNEIVQSHAYNKESKWVKYFTHAGHLHIKGLKMAKSLKNFITIKEILKTYSYQQLKLYFLSYMWYNNMDFSFEQLDGFKTLETKIKTFFSIMNIIKSHKLNNTKYIDNEINLLNDYKNRSYNIEQHLRNNFNTGAVIKELEFLIDQINNYVSTNAELNKNIIEVIYKYVIKIFQILGIDYVGIQNENNELVTEIINLRDKIRLMAKDNTNTTARKELYLLSDIIRDTILKKYNVTIIDLKSNK